MKALSNAAPAGILLTGLLFLSLGCTQTTSPATSSSPDPTSNSSSFKTSDYFFPPSANLHLVYAIAGTAAMPGAGDIPLTGNSNGSVSSYSATQATTLLVTTTTMMGNTTTETATSSIKVNPDGSVTDYEKTGKDSDVTTYPATMLDGNQWTMSPASGSIAAVKGKYLGTESVTTPAGTFSCIKILTTQADDGSGCNLATTMWYSKNLGMVKSSGLNLTSTEAGVATSSFEINLQSFTR